MKLVLTAYNDNMTKKWFEAKIKHTRVGEDGKERKVTELYMVDAMSYSEAEARVIEQMTEIIQGDFYIAGLKPSRITEIVEPVDGCHDKWFRGTVEIVDCDGISGREKKMNSYFLVAGADMDSALRNLQTAIEAYVVPCEIISLQDTAFMDVFPYFFGEDRDDARVE